MTEEKVSEFLKEIFRKKISKSYSGGSAYDVDIVEKEGRIIIEQSLRAFLLDNRDERIGMLEAKVYAYEQIIAKSNFAVFVLPENPGTT